MRRRVGIGVGLALAALLGAAFANGEVRRVGDLQVAFNGGFAPHSLPRERAVPVTLSVAGRIATTDGSHPPPLRWLRLEINRNGRLSTVGLPRCRASALQSTTSKGALARCQQALVGRGSYSAELGGGGSPVPSAGRILVFNTATAGKPALLLHLYGTTPIQASWWCRCDPSRSQGGIRDRARYPAAEAGQWGRLGHPDRAEIGRQYTYRGERRGYLSASCAAPAGFNTAIFPFARGTFRFAGGTDLDTSLTRDCRVRD